MRMQSKQSKKEQHARERRLLAEYRGDRCVNCGMTMTDTIGTYGLSAQCSLEFNHVDPDQKDTKIYKKLMEKPLCEEQFNEVDKCVLLCSTCHRILTAQNIQGEMRLNAVEDGVSITQPIKLQAIKDYKEKKFKLISADEPLLWLCGIRIGRLREKIVPAHQLDTSVNFDEWLRAVGKHRSVIIRRVRDNRVFLKIRRIKDKVSIEYDSSIGLPRIQMELKTQEGQTIWIRRGKMIHKESLRIEDSGWVWTEGEYREMVPTE